MSKLDKNYNWNGRYKVVKELEKRRYSLSGKGPEALYLFKEDNDFIRYAIIDDNFGMPALANTSDSEYSKQLRLEVVDILNNLVNDGFIEKCK